MPHTAAMQTCIRICNMGMGKYSCVNRDHVWGALGIMIVLYGDGAEATPFLLGLHPVHLYACLHSSYCDGDEGRGKAGAAGAQWQVHT
jgi:hypothetical protein